MTAPIGIAHVKIVPDLSSLGAETKAGITWAFTGVQSSVQGVTERSRRMRRQRDPYRREPHRRYQVGSAAVAQNPALCDLGNRRLRGPRDAGCRGALS